MVLCQGEQNYGKKKKWKIKRTFIFIIVLYSYPLDMNPKVMKIENIFNVYLIKKNSKMATVVVFMAHIPHCLFIS